MNLKIIERRYITSLSQDKSSNDILRETKIDNRSDKPNKIRKSSNNDKYHKMETQHQQDSLDDVPDFENQDVSILKAFYDTFDKYCNFT